VVFEPITLQTADGLTLEAELCVPRTAWAAAVLAHPHPLHGGSMRSIVTGALFEGLPQEGVACLRFNFRGVGASQGRHDEGRGERQDVVAGVDALAPITEGLPLALCGWSFGADTALAVGDPRVGGWVGVAPPLRATADLVAASDPRPTLLVIAEHDQFNPPGTALPAVEGWVATRTQVVPGADHYFVGKTDQVVSLALELVGTLGDPDGAAR
jgi:alpha/beta superfamily hydrolase